jgi:hypothetical protein
VNRNVTDPNEARNKRGNMKYADLEKSCVFPANIFKKVGYTVIDQK